MILFVVILLAILAGVGSYGFFNQGTIAVTWWDWHWTGVTAWWPVAAATVALGILLLLYMSYAGVIVNRWRVSRRMADHDVAIDDLRRENVALHSEVARLRGNQPGGQPMERRETA